MISEKNSIYCWENLPRYISALDNLSKLKRSSNASITNMHKNEVFYHNVFDFLTYFYYASFLAIMMHHNPHSYVCIYYSLTMRIQVMFIKMFTDSSYGCARLILFITN